MEKEQSDHDQNKKIEEELVSKKLLAIGKPGNPDDALKILTDDERAIHAASIEGDRRTLRADSFIPGLMAIIYFLIFLYFRSQGGYKAVKIDD